MELRNIIRVVFFTVLLLLGLTAINFFIQIIFNESSSYSLSTWNNVTSFYLEPLNLLISILSLYAVLIVAKYVKQNEDKKWSNDVVYETIKEVRKAHLDLSNIQNTRELTFFLESFQSQFDLCQFVIKDKEATEKLKMEITNEINSKLLITSYNRERMEEDFSLFVRHLDEDSYNSIFSDINFNEDVVNQLNENINRITGSLTGLMGRDISVGIIFYASLFQVKFLIIKYIELLEKEMNTNLSERNKYQYNEIGKKVVEQFQLNLEYKIRQWRN